ncbi:MAG: 2-hydroxychromene-2-carboxylate isomerase [Gammaproteobacteria bacterium]|nr:2-hydroxychromene-2-carboxylate isomerase [Gammaproteobacteria bacterium]
MHRLEFYFDCSSPWTYLAFEHAQQLLAGLPVEIVWKPILVGGLFNTVNPSVYANRENPVPAKAAYGRKDMQDWARFVGITIGAPPVFPVNSVKAMRGAFLALDQGLLVPYARRVFQAYWRDLEDISRDEVLRPLVQEVGLDPARFFTAITEDSLKARLRASTDELMRRGGFGSPTFFLDGNDMYFGNDRLHLIQRKIAFNPT